MSHTNRNYDIVIIGARVAGSATAMLLARHGARVLVVDRAAAGSDTLSTHALMRGAVTQLDRWDLLDRVVDAGTPAITRTVFRYGSEEVPVDVEPLYAPRRTVLDPIMVAGAREAGACVKHRTAVTDVIIDASGTVRGVRIDGPDGSTSVGADLVIGADGLRSWLARRLDIPVTRKGRASNASIAAYVEGTGLDPHSYQWVSQPDLLGGVIPTNHGQQLLFASMQPERFRREVTDGVPAAFARLLAELGPDLAAAAERGTQVGPVRSWPGHVSQFRQAHGPGWALVGDAGYFKDPGSAHGITNAFRDAELLANAVIDGDLSVYEDTRDRLSFRLVDALDRIIDFNWTLDELPERHRAMSKAMAAEHKAFQSILADRVAATNVNDSDRYGRRVPVAA